MPEPQKVPENVAAVLKSAESQVHPTVDMVSGRAGTLRIFLITFFAFLRTFKDNYRITLEFGGGHFVDVTEYPLMRVRVVWKNNGGTE